MPNAITNCYVNFGGYKLNLPNSFKYLLFCLTIIVGVIFFSCETPERKTTSTEIKKDTLYQVTITGETGYKFTEVKFVVNDTFEFQNEDNRRVIFSKKDTTFFKAKFNKR